MPLERGFPRFIPRFFGTKLKIIIGPSVTSRITPLLESYHEKAGGPNSMTSPFLTDIKGRHTRPRPPYYEGDSEEAKRVRIEIARVLREEVEKLGRESRKQGKAEGLKTKHESVDVQGDGVIGG